MDNRKRQRGSVFIEFGLGFTALWFVFMGTFQFGYTFWVYNAAMTQVADAARYGMRLTYDTRNTNYQTAIRNMVLYSTPTPTTSSRLVVPGLAASNVQVVFDPPSGTPQTVTVRITGWTVDSLFTNFTFNGRPSVTVKYAGKYQTTVPTI